MLVSACALETAPPEQVTEPIVPVAIPVDDRAVPSLSPSPSPADESIWVTIGADAEPVVRQAIADGSLEARWHGSNADGTIALIALRRAHADKLSRLMHEQFHRCGGFIAHESYEHALRAREQQRAYRGPDSSAFAHTIDRNDAVVSMLPALDQANLVQTIAYLSTQFNNRFHSTPGGTNAAQWLRGSWKQYFVGASRNDVSLEFVHHAGTSQPSVVLTILGDRYPDQVVVIGGHLDSTVGSGTGPNSQAPGADDNASGIATLSEVARVLLQEGFRPDRTIKFMAYAAEEVGLVGSRDIADTFAAEGVNVVGVLQLDMTNYHGSAQDIVLISDFTNAAQNAFIGTLIDTYLGLPWAYSACGYACSDHASWTQAGYPASIPFESLNEEHNPNIHTSADTLQNSDISGNHAMKFARLTLAYAVEMAKGDFEQTWRVPTGATTDRATDSLGVYETRYHGPFSVQADSSFKVRLQHDGYADVYVKFGEQPTTTDYDCRPYRAQPDERCHLIASTTDEMAYVMVRGYQADYWLDTAYIDSTPPPAQTTTRVSGALARAQEQHHGGYAVTPGTPFRAVLTGTGDADLYIRFGAPPTAEDYDCRPYLGGSMEDCRQYVPAGQTQVFVMVRGYDSADYELTLGHSP